MSVSIETIQQEPGMSSLAFLPPATLELVRYIVRYPIWLSALVKLTAQNNPEEWLVLEKEVGYPLGEPERQLLIIIAGLFLSATTIKAVWNIDIWADSVNPTYPPDAIPWLGL